MTTRAMHRRLDRIVRQHNHVEDYRRLSPEEILHLPDEQLMRIIADGMGTTVAQVEAYFENLSAEELDELIRCAERKLERYNTSRGAKTIEPVARPEPVVKRDHKRSE
ncbi:MAG: hypothetical protein KGJ66_02145 [Alphaproteobacteria bacterium]|nr:hypothetical protein [Alphaproteobacteria bacterium]